MKSDREFIDGIYAKAEQKKIEKPPLFKIRMKTVIPMVAAAAVIVIGLNVGKNPIKLNVLEDAGNSSHEISTEQMIGRARMINDYIEGNVIEVLEPYMGYGRIKVELNQENSSIPETNTLIIAYPEGDRTYEKGEYVTATLTQQQLGTQDYYILVD